MPREMTVEEVQKAFLGHIWAMIYYWNAETRAATTQDKLEGLAHSILAMLDGCCLDVPGFAVIPNPHPDDKAYSIEQGENWFPDNIDIGGDLAGLLFSYKSLFNYRPQENK